MTHTTTYPWTDLDRIAAALADLEERGEAFSPVYLALWAEGLDLEGEIYERGHVRADSLSGRVTTILRVRAAATATGAGS